jgi:lipoate-protein ligase A
MIPARWLDLGHTDPWTFHSTYAGVAATRSDDLLPTVVWGRVAPHVCLGQGQGMCELANWLDVPVVRRPLGGGTVWVDEMQLSYAIVAPLESAPLRHVDWYEWALGPAIATFRCLGLAVERQAEDLWIAGRKIAGSGAATIGRSAVVASSFLLHFPRARFTHAVAATSRGFRTRLFEALGLAMTDWSEHAPVPEGASVRAAFAEAAAGTLGWNLTPGDVSVVEAAEIHSWRAELSEPIEPGIRRVPGGVKLNAMLTLAMEGGAPVLRRQGAEAPARA